MAAKWLGHEVMNKGLEHLESNTTRMMVVTAYTLGQTYAQVIANDIGFIDLSPPGDITLSTSGNNRRATVDPQTITASSSNASPDLHVALLDVTNTEVLAIVEETTDQAITSGNDINVPAITVDITQPT